MDKTRYVDDFLGHEKSTNRRMHCITHNTHLIEHSNNLYFLIKLILNFSNEKPISNVCMYVCIFICSTINAVEDWLNSQAPITPIDTPPVNSEKQKRFDKYGEEIQDDIEYKFY